jgi:hypothetical protein
MSHWDIDPPERGASSPEKPLPGAPREGLHPVSRGSDRALGAAQQKEQEPSSVPPEPRSPKRVRTVSWVWAVVAVALLVGLLAGFYLGRARYSGDAETLNEATAKVGELQAALTASEDRNWTYYRLLKNYQGQDGPSSTSTTAVPSTPGGASYGDGVYLVDEDIPAGTYDGTVDGSVGYWARLKGTDGAIASIIENGIPKGPFVLTIVPADKAVELRGVTLTPR